MRDERRDERDDQLCVSRRRGFHRGPVVDVSPKHRAARFQAFLAGQLGFEPFARDEHVLYFLGVLVRAAHSYGFLIMDSLPLSLSLSPSPSLPLPRPPLPPRSLSL